MKIAILGPGGVGGLLAALLARAGEDVLLIARPSSARTIAEQGLQVRSERFGDFQVAVPVAVSLQEPVDVLIVATKATGLDEALRRVRSRPALVLPLLNGLDHLALLRERFGEHAVLAGTIRVESDRPRPGVIVHSSPFLLIEVAGGDSALELPVSRLIELLKAAGVSARAGGSEAQVMWSKLVRLNALACVTSAYDKLLGEIRATPELYADLSAAVAEAAAVARAEGAEIADDAGLQELERAHASLGSSMQRDIAAGREPELDAIPGAVLRAAARHDLSCPTIERLTAMIAQRLSGKP